MLLMSPAAIKSERQFKVVGASEVDAVMGAIYPSIGGVATFAITNLPFHFWLDFVI